VAKFCVVSRGGENERTAKPFCRRATRARHSLFWLYNFVLAGADWIRMRRTQADCRTPAGTDAAFEHSTGHGGIREALDGCAGVAFESAGGNAKA